MEIEVNKEIISIPSDSTVSMLLSIISLTKSVAVFVNGNQILMSQYDSFKLKDKDQIRVIRPLGGG